MTANWAGNPATWVDGSLTATQLNAEIRDRLDWIKAALAITGIDSDTVVGQLKSAPYAVSAYRDSNLSLNDSSGTAITLPSEYKDTDGLHSTSVSTQRITIPTGGDGDYLVGYSVEYAANSAGDRWAWFLVNGTAVDWGRTKERATAANTTNLSTAVPWIGASAGDYLDLFGLQSSGGSLAVSYANLWAYRIGV